MDGYSHQGSWAPPNSYDSPINVNGDPHSQNYPQQPSQQQPQWGTSTTQRGVSVAEGPDDREARYARMAHLTNELSTAVRVELSSRNQQWDVRGSYQEEEYLRERKQQVYEGLERLADEIRRAFRDRRKEAVMDLWSREQAQNADNQHHGPSETGPNHPPSGQF